MELIKFEIFPESEHQLRIYGTSEKPYFVAKDVCSILGLTNVSKSLQNIPRKYLTGISVMSGSQHRKMTLINESGLYKTNF